MAGFGGIGFCCCGCTPCTSGDYVVTLEQVGAGYVMLVGDANVIRGSVTNPANRNVVFWQNVLDFIGGGTVRAAGGASYTAFNPGGASVTGMEPTAAADDPTDLVGLGALFYGHHGGGGAALTSLGTITNADVRDWVNDDGGLLIIGHEYDGDANALTSILTLNAMLADVGACSRFLGGSYDTACGLDYCSAVTNSSSPLIDGTFGTASPDIRYAATPYVCGGTWIAKRAGASP